ncbi:hypothetical protein HPP92_006356 [Vanilla planifolia]|uniref:Uncharacterized protein n=1 Tax=Vanilla planifolia TaxID=51239 RepID=A0A835RFG5_VANPL|nr:hypothetical protein HPP92_006356 [Vanilla planifolia]
MESSYGLIAVGCSAINIRLYLGLDISSISTNGERTGKLRLIEGWMIADMGGYWEDKVAYKLAKLIAPKLDEEIQLRNSMNYKVLISVGNDESGDEDSVSYWSHHHGKHAKTRLKNSGKGILNFIGNKLSKKQKRIGEDV